jgi:uncharacterized membrane protein YbaN (DUF454 family)
MMRYALMFAGWICVALAVAGAILPLLPTTPFVLLAASAWLTSHLGWYRLGLLIPGFFATRYLLRAKTLDDTPSEPVQK